MTPTVQREWDVPPRAVVRRTATSDASWRDGARNRGILYRHAAFGAGRTCDRHRTGSCYFDTVNVAVFDHPKVVRIRFRDGGYVSR